VCVSSRIVCRGLDISSSFGLDENSAPHVGLFVE
jgi:hypothetical protein